ncbi:DUF3828 domain-containing protein [Sphingomonas crusticola]|uniref:DUF3828 domain-containing protein n=1 Tax=Sphingomonas crusticola TaxID=1697973 RepID=UPI000E25A64A|nr:DUF3828 domain-containing protein [Sphingomonas crusticola]
MKTGAPSGVRSLPAVLASLPLLLCLAAAAPPLANAEAYVIGIYRQIPGDFNFRMVRYSSKLGALMRRDDALARRTGGVGALDWVPFCECQDTDPSYRIRSSSVQPRGSNGAIVSILLRNGSDERFTVDLVRERGLWRVADVHGPSTPSLLALLQRQIPREEKSLRQQEGKE